MKAPLVLGLSLLCGAVANAQDAPSFVDEVLPILRDNCVDCHRAAYEDSGGKLRKPKGGLRLDGRVWIERGGEGGPVISPGYPDDSELYLLVSLDPGDPDVMPSKGDPLSEAQQAVIARWILAGADFGDWQGAALDSADSPADSPAAEPSRVELWRELSVGLSPLSDSTITKATKGRAQAIPLIPDGPLLRLSFAGHEAEIDDDAVAALSPMRAQICELVLRRCEVSGRSLRDCAKMSRLTKLDLSHTKIESAALGSLKQLPQLRSLNLFGTPVDDRVIGSLVAMGSLQQVYLGDTGFSVDGLARLRERRPDLRVHGDLELPGDRGRDQAQRGGRRGR